MYKLEIEKPLRTPRMRFNHVRAGSIFKTLTSNDIYIAGRTHYINLSDPFSRKEISGDETVELLPPGTKVILQVE